MKVFLLTLILLVGQTYIAHSQTDTILISSSIDLKDIEKSNKMVELLSSKNKNKKQAAADMVLAHPNIYNPAVTYVLSALMLEQNRNRDAMFWFYLSQVRARVDANICKDNSAKEIVSVLNMTFGPPINKIAFQNVDTLKNVVEQVIAFAKTNDETYDRRWVNLHGLDAFTAALDKDAKPKETSEPVSKWAEIKKTTVNGYYNDFIKYVITKERE